MCAYLLIGQMKIKWYLICPHNDKKYRTIIYELNFITFER